MFLRVIKAGNKNPFMKEIFERIWELALPYQDKRDDKGMRKRFYTLLLNWLNLGALMKI